MTTNFNTLLDSMMKGYEVAVVSPKQKKFLLSLAKKEGVNVSLHGSDIIIHLDKSHLFIKRHTRSANSTIERKAIIRYKDTGYLEVIKMFDIQRLKDKGYDFEFTSLIEIGQAYNLNAWNLINSY